eukprot:c21447_g1_i1 orf=521-1267(+)
MKQLRMDGNNSDSDICGRKDDGTSSESEEHHFDVEKELQEQVADIPFEDLQKARCDGSFSLQPILKKQQKLKRANKNRPMEMSSKKPVGRFREVIQAPKQIVRDPRFESLCGNYDEHRFSKAYRFLYDEELPSEHQRLQKLLEKEKVPETVEELRKHLSWIDSQIRGEEHRRKKSLELMEKRREEKEAVKQGKKPFYPKKSAIRKQELIERYKELKVSGKLEAFLAKRRRRNAAKDHRYVPYRRPQAA